MIRHLRFILRSASITSGKQMVVYQSLFTIRQLSKATVATCPVLLKKTSNHLFRGTSLACHFVKIIVFLDTCPPSGGERRCGALHPGDQLLAFDEHAVDGGAYSAEEVMCYLERCDAPYTRLHIAPAHLRHGHRYRGLDRPRFACIIGGAGARGAALVLNILRELAAVVKTQIVTKPRPTSRVLFVLVVCGYDGRRASPWRRRRERHPPGRGPAPALPWLKAVLLYDCVLSPLENSVSGSSTLNARKHRQRNYRQSSVPKLGIQDDYEPQPTYCGAAPAAGGVCRAEALSLQLEVGAGQASGLAVADDAGVLIVTQVAPHSPAYRCGCIQIRDRLLAVNGHEGLSADVANEILQRRNDSHAPKYLTLNIEFTIPNAIEAASGVFNVKLAKTSAGLGVTITGCKQRVLSVEEPMVISEVKPGSVAHRSGALAPGDQLLAINSQPLHNLSLDTAFNILQNSPDDIITLKIRKKDISEDCSNNHKHNAKLTLQSFSNIETKAVVHSGEDSGHHTDSPNNSAGNGSNDNGTTTAVFIVELVKQENGPIGLTIAGSEDVTQPILVSGLVEGGLAESCGKLAVGDELLSINGESVLNKPLSEAIKLLQQSGQLVQLQMCRKVTGSLDSGEGSARDSSHSTSSPGLSNDSAVESWDQNTPIRTSTQCGNSEMIEYAVPDKNRSTDKQPYSPTDEDKLMAYKAGIPYSTNDLPLPNYSLNNSLKTFHYEQTCIVPENTINNKSTTREDDMQRIEILTSNMKDCQLHNAEKSSCKCDYVQMAPYGIVSPKSRRPNWDSDYLNSGIYTVTTPQKSPLKTGAQGTSFQFATSPIYENDLPGLYSGGSGEGPGGRGSVHHVILYKDAIYDDYGFSVSDGLYERGVYINRIRKGGPADIVGLLRPYDRILQVNGTRTVDYDCCLTVPLIAAAGDRLEIVVQRLAHTHAPAPAPALTLAPLSPHTALINGWISRFGCPVDIITDRGTQFESALFKSLAQIAGFQHQRTVAYHPSCNGLVERFHRQLKAAIVCHESANWVESLPLVLLGIHSALKEDLETTSAELFYGQPLRLLGEFFDEKADLDYMVDLTELTSRLHSSPKSKTIALVSP
ncbi:Glutamate receptor-interacting protein 2 [Eumeta japonica]|uniref:Glutamate receptor-interacting protein 2 n=1 Tax=Eumeta variegata TaxID=151549 RepID=A0A4C1XRJ2_EUMVA|nr:Glutamate receptor-interacting protein 2 [Eumeta japonica]